MIRSLVARLIFGLCLATVASTASADDTTQTDKPIITWMLNDFPPFIQVDGTLPGKGFVDAAVRHIIERTPEFTHRFEVSGISRALNLMQMGTPVCHPALLPTTERLVYAIASRPVHFTLPHHVIARRDRADRLRPFLNAQGQINIDSLLSDTNLRTSITEQRAFVPVIQTALNARKGAPNILTTGVHFNAPFLQLAAGWVDYIIAYPVEPRWYVSNETSPGAALVYFPIAGVEEYVLGYMLCTKGPTGEALIGRINSLVAAAAPRPPWFDVEIALSDPSSAKRLEELLALHNPYVKP